MTEVEPLPEPQKLPEPEPPVQEKPVVTQTEPAAVEQVAAMKQPATSGAEVSASEDVNTTGSGTGEPDRGYLMRVRAVLEQHKQYPLMAQRMHMEGEVRLWFVLNRQGEVLDYRIAEGSGHSMLDEEVQRLIEEIEEFPPVPADFGADTLELVVPVSFHLAG
jgi:protein TonB